MKYLVGLNCTRCQKKFFILNNQDAKEQLCSSCLKLDGVNEEIKDSINEVLNFYKDGPSTGRYRIEEIPNEEENEDKDGEEKP